MKTAIHVGTMGMIDHAVTTPIMPHMLRYIFHVRLCIWFLQGLFLMDEAILVTLNIYYIHLWSLTDPIPCVVLALCSLISGRGCN